MTIKENGGELERLRDRMELLHEVSGMQRCSLGMDDWDQRLAAIGVAAFERVRGSRQPLEQDGPNVFLASLVHLHGGHTALMGDVIRSLKSGVGGNNKDCRLLLTDIFQQQEVPLPQGLLERLNLSPGEIEIMAADTLDGKLTELMACLVKLRPGRLFLSHHPQDPLGSALAIPEICNERYLLHHADYKPAFSLMVQGLTPIEFSPSACAFSLVQGLQPVLLPLRAEDYGQRCDGFLRRGALTTATCGCEHKYTNDHIFPYAETVLQVLLKTGGWHVHMGPLDERMLDAIAARLDTAAVDAERFIHLPWVDSLTKALWEHQVDVYLASYPIDGARAQAEVTAAGVPIVSFRKGIQRQERVSDTDDTEQSRNINDDSTAEDPLLIHGRRMWRNYADLRNILEELSKLEVLEEASRKTRASYERLHHPDRFDETLTDILNGYAGREGGVDSQYLKQANSRALGSFSSYLIKSGDEMANKLAEQKQRIDFLQEQRRKQDKRLKELNQRIELLEKQQKGGLRNVLRKMLGKG